MTEIKPSNLLDGYSEIISIYQILEILLEYPEISLKLIVKKPGDQDALIPSLRRIKKHLEPFTKYSQLNLNSSLDKIDDWLEHLAENYSSKSRWLKEPETLRESDAKRLRKDLEKIGIKILETLDDASIVFNNKKPQIISQKLTKTLDKSSKADLKEGLVTMNQGYTTAAYMLFFRVAESQVKSYYTKITGTKPIGEKSNWGNMLHVLLVEHKDKVNKNLTNLLYYLKDKRNEAQHPGKRFKQTDCEKILHYLSDLLKEVSK